MDFPFLPVTTESAACAIEPNAHAMKKKGSGKQLHERTNVSESTILCRAQMRRTQPSENFSQSNGHG